MSQRKRRRVSKVEAKQAPQPPPFGWVLAGVALTGVLVRLLPLWKFGLLGSTVDYDESVYFSAASLLWKGLLPYRDYVFVHPPGVILGWSWAGALSGWLGPKDAFMVARLGGVVAGAATTVFLGLLIRRSAGAVGGIAAALLYAFYFEAAGVELGTFIEPLLNLVCVAFAWIALDLRNEPTTGPSQRRMAAAGMMLGLAVNLKLIAGLWGIAWLFAARAQKVPAKQLMWGIAAAFVTFALVWMPFALQNWEGFFSQVVSFQLSRPVDGTPYAARWSEIWNASHWLTGLLALGLLLTSRMGTRDALIRLFGVVYVGLCATFLTVASYWPQYNSHLAVVESALAGLAVARIWAARRELALVGMGASTVTSLFIIANAEPRNATLAHFPAELPEIAKRLAVNQDGGCVASISPSIYLMMNRLPPRPPEAPLIVDSYATMLLAAKTSGREFTNAKEAFGSNGAQSPARELISHCPAFVGGWRSAFQLNHDSFQLLSQTHPDWWMTPKGMTMVLMRKSPPSANF